MSHKQTFYLRHLRRMLAQYFDLDELQTLTFDLSLEWEELAGEKRSTKSQSLITALARNGRLADLALLLKEERPNVDWPDEMPHSKQQIDDIDALEPHGRGATEFRELLKKIEEFKQGNLLMPILREYVLETLPLLDGKRKGRIVVLLNDLELLYSHTYEKEYPWGIEQLTHTPLSLATADLSHADLQGVNLFNNVLYEKLAGMKGEFSAAPNFTGVDFSYANLRNSNLRQAIFADADLSYADLSEAIIESKQLRLAKSFQSAILPNALSDL